MEDRQFAAKSSAASGRTPARVQGCRKIPLLHGPVLELYLDVLHLTAPSLRPGSVVLADDVLLFPDQLAPYLDYMRDPAHGFVSVLVPIGDGIEYSVTL